jgi:hypothetical protein
LHRSEDDGEVGYHAGHLEVCVVKKVGVGLKDCVRGRKFARQGNIAGDFWSFRV